MASLRLCNAKKKRGSRCRAPLAFQFPVRVTSGVELLAPTALTAGEGAGLTAGCAFRGCAHPVPCPPCQIGNVAFV